MWFINLIREIILSPLALIEYISESFELISRNSLNKFFYLFIGFIGVFDIVFVLSLALLTKSVKVVAFNSAVVFGVEILLCFLYYFFVVFSNNIVFEESVENKDVKPVKHDELIKVKVGKYKRRVVSSYKEAEPEQLNEEDVIDEAINEEIEDEEDIVIDDYESEDNIDINLSSEDLAVENDDKNDSTSDNSNVVDLGIKKEDLDKIVEGISGNIQNEEDSNIEDRESLNKLQEVLKDKTVSIVSDLGKYMRKAQEDEYELFKGESVDELSKSIEEALSGNNSLESFMSSKHYDNVLGSRESVNKSKGSSRISTQFTNDVKEVFSL